MLTPAQVKACLLEHIHTTLDTSVGTIATPTILMKLLNAKCDELAAEGIANAEVRRVEWFADEGRFAIKLGPRLPRAVVGGEVVMAAPRFKRFRLRGAK